MLALLEITSFTYLRLKFESETINMFYYPTVYIRSNRGVSHYRILPISRDIGWPVQQLDYFRYKATYTDCKSHFIELRKKIIKRNIKEIKKRQLLIEESDKTACHYGHLWLRLYTVH